MKKNYAFHLPFSLNALVAWLMLVLLLVSCETNNTEPADPYSYYPMKVGSYRIYEVSEDVYSAGNQTPVTSVWYEKEQVKRLKKDSAGRKEYIISVSTRSKPTEYWEKKKEYLATIYPDKVTIHADNEILNPLVFPYGDNVKWDGFRYFNINNNDPRAGYLFRYEVMDSPFELDTFHFKRTLKVSERADTTGPVLYRLGYKHYATGVGLVLDNQTDYDYLQKDGELVGYKVIGSGRRRIRKIIGYGE
jgi:hypothetical protein